MTLCFNGITHPDPTTDPELVQNKPIGAIKFVDYATGNLTQYKIQTKIKATPQGYGKLTANNILMPYGDQIDKDEEQVVSINGMIYLDDAWVLDTSGDFCERGGYLGTKDVTFAVVKRDFTTDPPTQTIESIVMPMVGVYAATFEGGVRIKKLTAEYHDMFLQDWGPILEPSVQAPDGGDVGKFGSALGGSHLFAVNKNGRNWIHDIQTINRYWESFGHGKRGQNFDINNDGDFTCGVVADLRLMGIIGSGAPQFRVSFELDQYGRLEDEQ